MTTADDTKLLKAILNGQSSFREEFLHELKKVEKKLENQINGVEKKVDNIDKKLTKRLDMIGIQLAELDADAPTKKEFIYLEERVSKIETTAIFT